MTYAFVLTYWSKHILVKNYSCSIVGFTGCTAPVGVFTEAVEQAFMDSVALGTAKRQNRSTNDQILNKPLKIKALQKPVDSFLRLAQACSTGRFVT